jgi:DNA replication protein DnaC
MNATPTTPQSVQEQLTYLKLPFMREHFETLAKEATQAHWGHVQYLAALIEGEALDRQQRATERRLRLARFPVIKTLESFQWSWPRKINRLQVQNLFRLKFVEDKANVIVLGGVGLGQDPSSYRAGLCRLLEGVLGALRHRRGGDQYPRRRPEHRPLETGA